MLVLSLIGFAHAGTLPVVSITDFGNRVDLAGAGWTAGFEQDAWPAREGVAYSGSDLNNSDAPGDGYGSGWAADNWLLHDGDPAVRQAFTEVVLRTTDNDALGLVACHDGIDSFYLVAWSSNSTPPPWETNEPEIALLKVVGGVGEVVATAPLELGEEWRTVRLAIADDQLRVLVDGAVLITRTDPEPLPAGTSGLYAYDAGSDRRDDTVAAFRSFTVRQIDEDDDLVADDVDNCEKVANADQLDTDDDGIGDVCDDDPGTDTGDTGTDTGDTGTDTGDTGADTGDTGTDTSDSGDLGPGPDFNDEDLVGTGACSCATGVGAGGALLPLLLLAVVRRRQG